MFRSASRLVVRSSDLSPSAGLCGSFADSRLKSSWRPYDDPHRSFYHQDLLITKVPKGLQRKPPLSEEDIGFGRVFSDHMFDVNWTISEGWLRPTIHKTEPLIIHPAATVLHYGCAIFEGMKAFRCLDGKIRMFRPEMNMNRMRQSARRAALPDFDPKELLQIIKELIRLDHKWVPSGNMQSLYIRPIMIGIDACLGVNRPPEAKLFVLLAPSHAYFKNPAVKLLANPAFVRACKGGVGQYKMASNYAPSLMVGKKALQLGCDQVLWLCGEEQWVTEVGSMNLFMFWKNEDGEDELITPALDMGVILPGVTRQSILDLAREFGEYKVSERDFTMEELRKASREDRIYEMFGSGTAAVISPIDGILYDDTERGITDTLHIPTLDSNKGVMHKLFDTLTRIQYGIEEKLGWTVVV